VGQNKSHRLAGIFIFRESLTLLQGIGVGLALAGATLINLPSGGL
jgi:multidrug transporter EmrE-like cation transporter